MAGVVQEALFGNAPRRVGTPNQYWVYSPKQVERFVETFNGRRNCYATLGHWELSEGPVSDKVLYDFDSPAKSESSGERWGIFEDDPDDDEVVKLMRNDPDIAKEILGPVVDEVRTLARRTRDDNVPAIGVFSGFGLHVHQLFQPMLDPAVAMSTTAYRYIDSLALQTPDKSILAQPERICRIPNCERVAGSVRSDGVRDGRSCGLFTIPLSIDEMASLDVQWLLDESHSPRSVPIPDAAERPEMRVWDDYRTGVEEEADVPPRPLHPEETDFDDDGLRRLLEGLLKMPCMVERLLDDPNPDHDVRVNATVMLLNVGLDPDRVIDLFAQIGWVDWDRAETKKQVLSIYRNGYADLSCSTLRSRGLCTRSEEPSDCHCFGWSGGRPEWIA